MRELNLILTSTFFIVNVIMSSAMSAINFIFLHGRGGSGKDTQAELLAKKFPDAMRFSTGDMYRGVKSNSGEYSQFYPLIEPYIDYVDSGHFLPDNVILQMVNEVVDQKSAEGISRFIFTGFPRTNDQLDAIDEWTKSLKDTDREVQVNNICYAVLEQHARTRSEKRRQEYEEQKMPIRADDDPVAVENKLKSYRDLTLPMLKRLSSEGRLSIVKASGSIEQVFNRTLESLGYPPQSQEGASTRMFERR